MSPEFLFRIERDPAAAAPGQVYRVSDVELASRLSFFLWSTIPDEELLDLAEHGRLKDPAVLRAPGAADARRPAVAGAGRRTSPASGSSCGTSRRVRPDSGRSFRSTKRCGSRSCTETTLFVAQHLPRGPQPARSALEPTTPSSTSAWPSTTASRASTARSSGAWPLTDVNRRGLLGQGSVLTVTSYPNRTSVVQRGKWMLENLLGTPPPPPPAERPGAEGGAERQGAVRCASRCRCTAPTRCARPATPDGPDRFRAGELRRRRAVARRGCGRADRREREAARRHRVPGPGRAEPAAADEVPGRFRAHGHREAADLCARTRRRVLRLSDDSIDRSRGGARQLSHLVAGSWRS